ncbi:hypothetical protein SK224_08210 [Microbacterium sp. BG28]|uniref:hypothetical protein n=1 Tax=Microbacterium sp. BG28 TaxID=3097356 RepID=UPI002A59B1BF|nr:hypothetical protein [Microbacterium sp. BG28]MDY0829111.1 hypothetical protein [Microbacterium sp. BG28]
MAAGTVTLADRVDPAESGPKARAEYGPDGGEFSGITSETPIVDWTDVFIRFNLDPNVFEVVDDTVRCSTWQQSKRLENGERDVVNLYSYRALFRRRTTHHDLPALYASARRKPAKRFVPSRSGKTSVPVLADLQIGKVGSRGGTPELIDRMVEKREKLAAELKRRKPEDIVLPDINDLFENFESGGNPMFTNDLSLAQQMDVAAVEVYELVKLASRFGRVRIPVVPSNHTAWRRGSQNLGRPGDDLGIFVHKQVERTAKAAKLDAEWIFPAMYDETVTVDVRGTILGLAHGNQFRPKRAPDWWAKQTHGAQPVGEADILITGHYHHLMVWPTGRNPRTGRSKWWLQAPTLDNGSDWYRNIAGDDSDPGLLLFDITDNGFDLQSLTVL